jgi:DNA polymerase III delta subunit
MVIALTGGNSFSLRRRLNELVGKFVKEHGDLALERIDAEEVEYQTILDALQNLPFLAEATYLVERAGTNQALLSNELDKLITYQPKINRGSINLLVDSLPQSKVFDLLDAAFSGKKSRALELYNDQRAQKIEPQAILAMIIWQLQLLALTKYADGKSAAAIAKDVGMNPYPISKAASLSHKLNEEKFKSLVDFAFEIDLKSKTTNLDLEEALKTYITTL